MAWKKVVQIIAVSACPKCGNAGFDLEPGEDIDDLNALIRCGQCGYVCPGGEFMRPVRPKPRQQTARIYQTVELPDGSGKLVLSDWSAYSDTRLDNLVLLDPAGFFVWAAQLPNGTSPDCFVGVSVDAGAITAQTWSGYIVTVDPGTGSILAQRFVKRPGDCQGVPQSRESVGRKVVALIAEGDCALATAR